MLLVDFNEIFHAALS